MDDYHFEVLDPTSNSDPTPTDRRRGVQPEVEVQQRYNARTGEIQTWANGILLRTQNMTGLEDNIPMSMSSPGNDGNIVGVTTSPQSTGLGALEQLFQSSYQNWSNQFFATNESLWTTTPSQPQTPQMQPKRRIARIKKKVTSEQLAKAIAKHTKKKTILVEKRQQMTEATMVVEQQEIDMRKLALARQRNRTSFYKAQITRLKQTPEEIQEYFEKSIANVKAMENVEDVFLDGRGRIIVETKPLFVQKEIWPKKRLAGKYQIRIDFSKDNINAGVHALNITHRYMGRYDSPTINQTSCCWGNAAEDVENDFQTQNLEELVSDMIPYCCSPYEQHGFLGREGNKKEEGWEVFFGKELKKCPKNYDFEAHDRKHSDGGFNDPTPIDNTFYAPSLDMLSTASQGYQISPDLRIMNPSAEPAVISNHATLMNDGALIAGAASLTVQGMQQANTGDGTGSMPGNSSGGSI